MPHHARQGGVYDGDWLGRAPHGKGRMVYSDGSVYIGGWKNFKFHGHGKLVQEDGVVFEGEWREGCMHGSGRLDTARTSAEADADGEAVAGPVPGRRGIEQQELV